MLFLSEFLNLSLRLIPILIIAVFVAELARQWLGAEKLRRLLSGKHPYQGQIRAAILGALIPFCECGAFPLMIGLLQAGVPLKNALTFFIISPVVSIPAFLILMGIFGLKVALLYLVITLLLAIILVNILTYRQQESTIFKQKLIPQDDNAPCSKLNNTSQHKTSFLKLSFHNAKITIYRILPFAILAMLLAAFLKVLTPSDFFEKVLTTTFPYNIPLAAAIGIPIYGADCTKISIIAPFLGITNAIGPGVAFLLAGAGTSINGLIFMSSIFKFNFLISFVIGIFISAIIAGFTINFFF